MHGHAQDGGLGIARCGKSIHMSPDVNDDISKDSFLSQVL